MPLGFCKFILYSLFRDYSPPALLVPLFPHTQHQENNKQYEICKNTGQSGAPYLIVSIISLGRHAISQGPINKVAAAVRELQQSVNKSHFSNELYMNSCWIHLEFGELINVRIGLKSLMKREKKYCAAPSIITTRNMRNCVVWVATKNKVFKYQQRVLLMLETVWKLERIS